MPIGFSGKYDIKFVLAGWNKKIIIIIWVIIIIWRSGWSLLWTTIVVRDNYLIIASWISQKILNQAYTGRRPMHTWFLKISLVCTSVCVCVCVFTPRALITSGVIWCDIYSVWLVKQVLRLFPTCNYFIGHLPSLKWMGMAILTQHVMHYLPKITMVMWYYLQKDYLKDNASFIKVSGQMHSNAF